MNSDQGSWVEQVVYAHRLVLVLGNMGLSIVVGEVTYCAPSRVRLALNRQDRWDVHQRTKPQESKAVGTKAPCGITTLARSTTLSIHSDMEGKERRVISWRAFWAGGISFARLYNHHHDACLCGSASGVSGGKLMGARLPFGRNSQICLEGAVLIAWHDLAAWGWLPIKQEGNGRITGELPARDMQGCCG